MTPQPSLGCCDCAGSQRVVALATDPPSAAPGRLHHLAAAGGGGCLTALAAPAGAEPRTRPCAATTDAAGATGSDDSQAFELAWLQDKGGIS